MDFTESARDVIIKLKIEQDKNNPRAFQGIADAAKKAYEKIGGYAKKAATDEEKELDRLHQRHRQRQLQRAKDNYTAREKEAKDRRRAAEDQEHEEQRLHQRHRQRQLERAKINRTALESQKAEAQRAAAAQEREEQRLHDRHRQRQLEQARENRRLKEQEALEAKRAADRTAKAEEQAAKASEAAAKRAEAAHRMANAKRMKQIFETIKGFEQLGRAAVLFGVVSEESMEKAVKKLAAFEATVQAAKGLTNIVGKERMGQFIGGLGGLVTAGAGRVGSAVGASAVGGGAAATTGAFLAALASTVTALKVMSEAITGNAQNIDSWSNKIAEGEVSFAQWVRKTTGINPFAGFNLVGLGPTGAQLDQLNEQEERLKRMAAAGAHEREMQERFRIVAGIEGEGQRERDRIGEDRAGVTAGRGLIGDARDEAINAARRRHLAGIIAESRGEISRIDGGGRRPGEDIDATRENAIKRQMQAQERLIQLEEERLSIAERKGRSALEVEKEALRASKERLQQVKSELSEIRGRFQSEAERFAELDPVEARQTILAAQKARAGGELSFSEARRLKGFSEFDSAVADAGVRRARELGGGFILDPLKARADALAKEADELKVKVEDQKIKVELVEADNKARAKQIGEEIADSLAKTLDERDQLIKEQTQLQIDEALRRHNQKQGTRDRGAGGIN